MTVVDLPQRERSPRVPFQVEVFSGDALAAARWPSVTDVRDFRMYVFQSREFLDVWLNTIGKAARIEPCLVAVSEPDGRPVLFLPLAIETKFNVRLLRFIDCGVADYNAPVVAADRSLSRQEFTALWGKILSLLPAFDVVDLKKIASNVAGVVSPLSYLPCTPFAESGHLMSLAQLRAGADGRRPVARWRRKLAHYAERLSEGSELRFVVNPTGAELGAVTERLFALKRQRYLSTAASDFLAEPGVEHFYREMMRPERLGTLGHLSALTVDGAVASAHLGFIAPGRFNYILPAYDDAFRRHRVGHLLLQHLIDQSAAQGFDTFDLGVGDNRYKNTWATHRLALGSHERAVTTAGRLYLQMRRVRRFVAASGVRTWFRAAS